ncbi:hypothetical protein [Arthrobacter gyeryongensis]|uniref:hypothetical protein n=1 Tax=Arthrobacter gyeryongensis TaxID=1650592 RepID=UPI0031EEE09B
MTTSARIDRHAGILAVSGFKVPSMQKNSIILPHRVKNPDRHADYRKHQPDVLGNMKEVRAKPAIQLSNF